MVSPQLMFTNCQEPGSVWDTKDCLLALKAFSKDSVTELLCSFLPFHLGVEDGGQGGGLISRPPQLLKTAVPVPSEACEEGPDSVIPEASASLCISTLGNQVCISCKAHLLTEGMCREEH